MKSAPLRNGDYWVICDICGFKFPKSETRFNWKRQLVCDNCYSPKHPQLTIVPVRESIGVPVARPDIETTLHSTTLGSSSVKDALTITVASASNFADNIAIGITLNDGIVQWTQVKDVSGTTITIYPGLIGAADSGNAVKLNVASSKNFSTATITADDL